MLFSEIDSCVNKSYDSVGTQVRYRTYWYLPMNVTVPVPHLLIWMKDNLGEFNFEPDEQMLHCSPPIYLPRWRMMEELVPMAACIFTRLLYVRVPYRALPAYRTRAFPGGGYSYVHTVHMSLNFKKKIAEF